MWPRNAKGQLDVEEISLSDNEGIRHCPRAVGMTRFVPTLMSHLVDSRSSRDTPSGCRSARGARRLDDRRRVQTGEPLPVVFARAAPPVGPRGRTWASTGTSCEYRAGRVRYFLDDSKAVGSPECWPFGVIDRIGRPRYPGTFPAGGHRSHRARRPSLVITAPGVLGRDTQSPHCDVSLRPLEEPRMAVRVAREVPGVRRRTPPGDRPPSRTKPPPRGGVRVPERGVRRGNSLTIEVRARDIVPLGCWRATPSISRMARYR